MKPPRASRLRRIGLTAVVLFASSVGSPAIGSYLPADESPSDGAPPNGLGEPIVTSHIGWLDPASSLLLNPGELTNRDPWIHEGTTNGPRGAVLHGTSHYDWFISSLGIGQRYRFADPKRFVLLTRFVEPSFERSRADRTLFLRGFSPERLALVPELAWHLSASENEFEEHVAPLWAARPEMLSVAPERKCARNAAPVTVVVAGMGPEYERLPLVDCEGTIAPFALDRMSVLARVPGTPNPGVPLPPEPAPSDAWPEEWADGIRLLHPRLLWLLQQIGEAFPRHTIHIMSGYRRDSRATSPHRKGRALDIRVSGVEPETLFAFCRTLKDTGCGYYPYHPFVHLDTRTPGLPAVYWVDASRPGEPSNYVDAWPGVVESGALRGAGSD